MHGALKENKRAAQESVLDFLGTRGAAQGLLGGGSVLRRAVPTDLSDGPGPVTPGKLVNKRTFPPPGRTSGPRGRGGSGEETGGVSGRSRVSRCLEPSQFTSYGCWGSNPWGARELSTWLSLIFRLLFLDVITSSSTPGVVGRIN